MRWFDLIFPVAMLAFPLVFLLLSPRGPGNAQNEALRNHARGLTLLLAGLTVALITVHVLLWANNLGFARYMFVGFFPLWFGLAMPALSARNPDFAAAHPTGTAVRRASLAPRDNTPLAPRWMWTLSALIGAAFVIGTAIRPWGAAEFFTDLFGSPVAAFEGTVRSTWLRSMIVQISSMALLFPMLFLCMNMVRREPEPLDARSSPELLESYASLRRFKAQAMLWLFGVGMNLLFGACFMLMAWLPSDSRTTTYILAIGGGAAGSALGIAGGVIGTVASMRRARINALIRSLDAR